MRIVIDLQGAQTASRYRGIGRYSLAFAKAMVGNRGNHEIILALNNLFPETIEPIRSEFANLLPPENIRIWHALGPVFEGEPSNTWRREVAKLIREAFLISLQPDIIHITSLFEGYVDNAVTSIGIFDNKVPVSVTVYDLIPLLNPNHYFRQVPLYESYYRGKISYLKKSSLLLAISNFSKHEAFSVLNFPEELIFNKFAATDDHFCPLLMDENEKQIIREKFGLVNQFILYTGGADERKNLLRLIRAYSKLPYNLRHQYQLVFAGKIHPTELPSLLDCANSSGLNEKELILTGYISDEELVKLYNLCDLFVFPSWHEGFGLPVLEAMKCGAPVIASNASSLPEIIENEEALFDPMSEESILNKMVGVLNSQDLRQRLRDHGIKQAKKFTWDNCAKIAITAFETFVKEKIKHSKTDDVIHDLILRIGNIIPNNTTEKSLINLSNLVAKNFYLRENKSLFVDISELVQRDVKTGVQRVTRSILQELLLNPPDGYRVELVYATTDRQGYRYAKNFTRRFLEKPDVRLSDDLVEGQAGDVFLGLDLQPHVVKFQGENLASLRREGLSIYFVIYDMLPILLSEAFPHGAETVHVEWLKTLIKFDGVICISNSVAKELQKWLQESSYTCSSTFKISSFHLGADVSNSMPSLGIPKYATFTINQLLSKVSFLMVGTLEPRKSHAQTLVAFEQLWAQDIDVNLVIVGKQGWMVDTLIAKLRQHPEFDQRLFWLESISDEYLEKVYAASNCLIAASQGEGFGLPLIEAAQHKLPIIARDIPVFREVAGEHAFYFNGFDPESLATSIKNWLGLYKIHQHPCSNDMPWLTWRESTRQLLEKLGICYSENTESLVN